MGQNYLSSILAVPRGAKRQCADRTADATWIDQPPVAPSRQRMASLHHKRTPKLSPENKVGQPAMPPNPQRAPRVFGTLARGEARARGTRRPQARRAANAASPGRPRTAALCLRRPLGSNPRPSTPSSIRLEMCGGDARVLAASFSAGRAPEGKPAAAPLAGRLRRRCRWRRPPRCARLGRSRRWRSP